MFMLKDADGRTVVVQQSASVLSFWAKVNGDLERVDEAVVHKGDEVFLDVEYVERRFDAEGFNPQGFRHFDEFTRGSCEGAPVEVHTERRSQGFLSGKFTYLVNGEVTDEATYERVVSLCGEMNAYDWLRKRWYYGDHVLGDNVTPQAILALIGIGNVVTPESLVKGCPKGENRPRLMKGDTVEVEIRKKKVMGSVVSMASKVSVLRQDGKKGTYAYSKVRRAEGSAVNEEIVSELEPTIAENFAHVLGQVHRLYRAKLTYMDVTYPVFAVTEDEKQREFKGVATCECPLCGWQLADISPGWRREKIHEFRCVFCRERAIMCERTGDTVTLLMLRQPAKNEFAVKEARCCGNCGLFHFEYGRQGKRSTGFCTVTNQCVQAFNTCNYWFPRLPETYNSNVKQHMTNLGYSVTDRRATDRADVRDTAFRKEDLKVQKQKADRMKMVYAQAYAKFLADLSKLGGNRKALDDSFTDEAKQQVREHFGKVLDDGR